MVATSSRRTTALSDEPRGGAAGISRLDAPEDDALQLLGMEHLADGAHQETALAVAQLAAGDVDVLLRQTLAQQVNGQAVVRQRTLVDFHLDFFFEAALHLHRRHAFETLQRALDALLGHQAQLHQIIGSTALATGHRQTQNRVEGRVVAQQHRRLGFQRQAHDVEALAHVECGEVHRRAPGRIPASPR